MLDRCMAITSGRIANIPFVLWCNAGVTLEVSSWLRVAEDEGVEKIAILTPCSVSKRIEKHRRKLLCGILLAAGSFCVVAHAQQSDPGKPSVVQPGAPGRPSRTLPASTRATLPPLSH